MSALPMMVRIVITAFLGIVVLGIAVVWIAGDNISRELHRRATVRQDANMRIALEVLQYRGAEYKVADGKFYAGTVVINDNFEVVDRIQTLIGGVATIFMGDIRVSTNVKKPDGSRAVGTKLAQGPVYETIFRDHKSYRGEADILGEPYFTAYDPLLNASGEVIGVMFVGVKQRDFLSVIPGIVFNIATAVVVVGLVICFVLGWLISRLLAPLNLMEDAMLRLAEGDHTVFVPACDRGDEIGRMGRAVQIFKDHMIRADQLTTRQRTEQEARERRAHLIEGYTSDFDRAISAVVQGVTASATQLEADAGGMTGAADQASGQASAVAAAAREASSNVETVAAATEELTASVNEIRRQVGDSARIAETAVEEAGRTNTTVAGLLDAAQKIGAIVQLINNIASQTNLLALNATIEAARAGDAGKGFAVVASEVKNLANQTAKATDDIQAQVADMQGVTGSAVDAIKGIAGTIRRMSEITTTIAAAVDQQGAATNEIARNVEAASRRTLEVSDQIGGVTEAAGSTGRMAGQTLSAARELSGQAGRLRTEVDGFIGRVRAA
ncbi:MAG: cache domain-containing protein [Rhodospirillaceae bacterium]